MRSGELTFCTHMLFCSLVRQERSTENIRIEVSVGNNAMDSLPEAYRWGLGASENWPVGWLAIVPVGGGEGL